MAVDKKTDTNINRTEYTTYPTTGRGTINTGTSNLNVAFGGIGAATSVLVTNFDTTNDLKVKFNFAGNNTIVLSAGKTLVLNDEYVTRILLTNDSGSAIQYQVVVFGG